MKRKIWILNHYASGMLFEKGGRHYSISKYLRKAGYEPTIFCCNAKHNSQAEVFCDNESLWNERRAEDIDVPFVFVRGRAYIGNGKQRVLNMVDFYRNVKKAAKEYAQRNGAPDVIYASSVHPLTLVAGIQLAKYFGIKCICEVRDLWPESLVSYDVAGPKNPAVWLLRRLEKWIYKKADAIVFTMEGAYDYIIEQGWEKEIPRSKVHFINNGVDLELFDENKERYRIEDADLEAPESFNVVYVGSIRKVNNLGILLDAAKRITDPRVKILIWGDGDELPQLRKRVAEEKLDHVIFKGRVDKRYIPYIVSHADLNIAHNSSSPIFKYGISFNKLFEYFAAGKPILCDFNSSYNPAVRFGACREMKEITADAIAQAIEAYAALDAQTYRSYCEKAGAAAQAYSFETLTKALLNVIEGK